jgi:protein disulfide-isomerase-like protein
MTSSRLCIILFALCASAFAASKSDVVELDAWNFDKVVLTSELPFMVEFYAPWCGHCKQLAPEWEKAATNLKDILPIGKVDCTAHGNLCNKYGVKGYPTIKCFSEKGKNVFDYQQEREAAAIVRYALGAIRAVIFDVKNDKNLQTFFDAEPVLPHVLLFTTKDKPTPLFKALAVTYQEKIIFGLVPESAKSIVENFGVTTFPSLLKATPTEHTVLEGAASAEGLRAALAKIAGSVIVEPAAEEAKTESAPKKAAPKKVVEAEWVKTTAGNLDVTCESQLCILAFVNDGETDKGVLSKVLESYTRDGKFKFVEASSDSRAKFSLGAESAFVVYNAKRGRYAKTDALTEAEAKRLVDRVVGGDVKWTNL